MYKTDIPAWQERFGWFWYNNNEILKFTEQEIDDKVKMYADMGITTLIGFTSTHFRFNFMRHIDIIHARIRLIVEKCHKYGIKFVEHHSSTLFFAPETDKEWENVLNFFKQKGNEASDWDGYIDALKTDAVINGHHISEFCQVDGSSGKLAKTPYNGHAMCHNNPYYREAYFKYLETVYPLGIDGIMTDDVQYFGNDQKGRFNACTCVHCRRKFKEQYGYELPQPEDWDEFYGNFDNPVFVAWKRFKVESTAQFIRDVTAHYEKLGYQMMRPNYISEIIWGNPTSYPFEQCADIWDFVFQENCTMDIISSSFASFACEAIHRYAMGSRKGCPSMSLFYPSSADSLYFSWALSKCWGQLYLQTSEDNVGIDNLELEYRRFETAHIDMLTDPKKLCDVGYLYSPLTRENTKKGEKFYIPRFRSWLQASYISGFGTDLIFETDSLEVMNAHKYIVCAYSAMLDESTLENLSSFVRGGGTMIVIGDFGCYDSFGKCRMGTESFFGAIPKVGESKYGNGKIIVLSEDSGTNEYQRPVGTNRYLRSSEVVNEAKYVVQGLRDTAGMELSRIIGRKKVEAVSDCDVLASGFATKDAIAVHLVNITGVIPRDGEKTAHFYKIKPFCSGAEPCCEVTVDVKCNMEVKTVEAYTPEHEGSTALTFINESGRVRFTVPYGTFAGYCLVEIK